MVWLMQERDIGIEEARAKLGPLVDDAAVDGVVSYLTRRGRRHAAIVPLDRVIRADEGVDAEPGHRSNP